MFKATFSGNDVSFDANFDSGGDLLSAYFEKTMLVEPKVVHIDTTANWNRQRDLIGRSGHLYIYVDYTTVDGVTYPGFKYGDGSAYLIDSPFVAGNEGGYGAVHVGSTDSWNSQPALVGIQNHVYVYTDYAVIEGVSVPGMKVGDGSAYLIDLPFIGAQDPRLDEHMANTEIHITNAERLFWNNKVTCFMSNGDEETIVFTKDNVL